MDFETGSGCSEAGGDQAEVELVFRETDGFVLRNMLFFRPWHWHFKWGI